MANTIKINHVAIVVEDIEDAMAFWRDGLGLEIEQIKDIIAEHGMDRSRHAIRWKTKKRAALS